MKIIVEKRLSYTDVWFLGTKESSWTKYIYKKLVICAKIVLCYFVQNMLTPKCNFL